METLRTPAATASLLARNLVPLAGVLLLGWSPANLIVLYFLDTFLGLGVVLLLVMAHVTGNDRGERFTHWHDWAKGLAGLAVLGAIMALPIAFPLILYFADHEDRLIALLAERDFIVGLLTQLAACLWGAVQWHRELLARDDDDRVLAGRALLIVARWMLIFVVSVTGAFVIPGPAIGGILMMAVYAGASVYFELFPDRAARFVRGRDAKPIVFEGDVDGPGSPSSGKAAASSKRAAKE
jgi:hypothetical protein